MMELAGYVLEPLRVDSEFTLYRGRQAGNAVSILCWRLRQMPQTPWTCPAARTRSFSGGRA